MKKTETKEDVEKNIQNTGDASADAMSEPKNEGSESENQAAEETQEPAAVEKLKEELESAKDKYIRLYSEFENYRKRTAKEKLELIQSGNEQLIKTLLPVADYFERAEHAFPDK